MPRELVALHRPHNMEAINASNHNLVHVIPGEDDKCVPSFYRKRSRTTSTTMLFDESSQKLHQMCTSLVKKEAMIVRKRLMNVMGAKQQQEEEDEAVHPNKRQRTTPSQEQDDKEQAVRHRAARMLRMVDLLKQYQQTMAELRSNLAELETEEEHIV